MNGKQERDQARRMIPESARVWARYRELRAEKSCNLAPEGCPPSVIAQGLNDHGLSGDEPFDVVRLRAAELFETTRPEVSVIIPAKNTSDLLFACVKAVALHAAYLTEIIVVDGGSTDGTLDMLDEFGRDFHSLAVVRRRESRSFAESCNAGAREARGRFLIFLNSDAVPTAHWDAELIGALKSDPRSGAAGCMSNAVKGKQRDWEANYVESKEDERPYEKYSEARYIAHAGKFLAVDDLSGLCLAVPADVWDAVGEFDERFVPGNFEDNDWCLRARGQGHALYIARACYVHHFGGQTFAANALSWHAAMEENKARFLAKWSHEMKVAA